MNSGPCRLQETLSINVSSDCCIQLHQTKGKSSTTGWLLWPVAVDLCKFLISEPHRVLDKVVLEVGSGTGLVGLVASHIGAKYSVLTDLQEAMPLCDENLKLNISQLAGVGTTITRPLYWGNAEDASAILSETGQIDVILGSDVVYHQSESVLNALVASIVALSGPSTVVIIAYEDREGLLEDEEFFFSPMRSHFSSVELRDLGNSRWLYIFGGFIPK